MTACRLFSSNASSTTGCAVRPTSPPTWKWLGDVVIRQKRNDPMEEDDRYALSLTINCATYSESSLRKVGSCSLWQYSNDSFGQFDARVGSYMSGRSSS
jgi:hypothetical protein